MHALLLYLANIHDINMMLLFSSSHLQNPAVGQGDGSVGVLVCCIVSVIKHQPKTNVGRNGFTSGYMLQFILEKPGRNWKQKPMEEMWLTALVPIGSCSVSIHIQSRLTCLGVAPPTVGRALLYPITIKNMPQRPQRLPSPQVTLG